jgi:hypothetical protein
MNLLLSIWDVALMLCPFQFVSRPICICMCHIKIFAACLLEKTYKGTSYASHPFIF